jgi:hypothetical protein
MGACRFWPNIALSRICSRGTPSMRVVRMYSAVSRGTSNSPALHTARSLVSLFTEPGEAV